MEEAKRKRKYNKEARKARYEKKKKDPAFRAENSKRSVKWCKDNKERRNAGDKARRQTFKKIGKQTPGAKASRRARFKLKLQTINAYGGGCSCCEITELEFLCIDHINNDGAKHRRENKNIIGGGAFYRWLRDNNYPKDVFQCLCVNCNWSKRIGGGVCIHKRKRND